MSHASLAALPPSSLPLHEASRSTFVLWPSTLSTTTPTLWYYQSPSPFFSHSTPLSLPLSQTPIMKPLPYQPTPYHLTMIAPMPTLGCTQTLSSLSPPWFRSKKESLLFQFFRFGEELVDLANHSQESPAVHAMLAAQRWASAKAWTTAKPNLGLRLLMGMIMPTSWLLCPLCLCPLTSPLMADLQFFSKYLC